MKIKINIKLKNIRVLQKATIAYSISNKFERKIFQVTKKVVFVGVFNLHHYLFIEQKVAIIKFKHT